MDVLPRITRQLTALFHEMSPFQRVTSVVVSCLVLLGFAWIVFQYQPTVFQPVSYGKVFTSEELESAERALRTAGMTDFRREGRKLLVPAKDLDRYNASLLASDALPADLGAQMIKQYERMGPFSTDRQRQQMKDLFLLQELRRLIKEVPDVEDAHVTIASPERRSNWNQKQRATANVSIKPRTGRELSSTLVSSLRHVVASMVPDLKPTDVTIFDLSRGQAYIGDASDDPTDSRYLQRAREFTRQYEQQIQKALSHIPLVSVTVHVDLDSLKSSIVRSETVRSRKSDHYVANRPDITKDAEADSDPNSELHQPLSETVREVSERQLASEIPKSVQVSVSIPRGYIRDVINRRIAQSEKHSTRLDPATVEEDELTKVERIVGHLIPVNSRSDAISVTFFDQLVEESPIAISKTHSDWTTLLQRPEITGLVAVCLILVAALMMTRRSETPVKSGASIELSLEEEVSFTKTNHPTEAIRPTSISLDQTASLRDEVRKLVEGDPVSSAAILSDWLSEVRT